MKTEKLTLSGTCRYVGPIEEKYILPEIFIGVELDEVKSTQFSDYVFTFLSQNSRSQAIPEFSEADNILIVHTATGWWSPRQS